LSENNGIALKNSVLQPVYRGALAVIRYAKIHTGSSGDSTSQLVQAMAGLGGGSGAVDGFNTSAFGADTSQQTFLTAPHA